MLGKNRESLLMIDHCDKQSCIVWVGSRNECWGRNKIKRDWAQGRELGEKSASQPACLNQACKAISYASVCALFLMNGDQVKSGNVELHTVAFLELWGIRERKIKEREDMRERRYKGERKKAWKIESREEKEKREINSFVKDKVIKMIEKKKDIQVKRVKWWGALILHCQ